MFSSFTIVVEHGEDTDAFEQAFADAQSEVEYNGLRVMSSSVKVDIDVEV